MDSDVIVVGAGPAGLMLAGELRTADVDVIVLERLPQATGQSRGLGFTARTMEVFDQRGLLERFDSVETSDVGHFGGLPLDFGIVHGAHFGAKNVPQARTEEMLTGWVSDLSVPILRGHEVVAVADHGDSVSVEVKTPEGVRQLRAAYVVGCDGGRSTIRKAGGFEFPGTAATMEMFLADIRGVHLEERMIGETLPGGMVMVGHLGDGLDRIIVCERGTPPKQRVKPLEFSEIADAWQRLTGDDIHHAEPVWMSSFGNATRQASKYRKGRILLAGDAAHIHLPAGGQGMNASIQDSVNLGWKLAATVHGWAPEGLLDSYHDERHAVGERLLMNTQAQGLLFLSGSEMQPLRDLFSELIRYEVVAKHLVGMVSGLEIRYDVGPGMHPLLGCRMPNQRLVTASGPSSVFEILRRGRGLLLDFTSDANVRKTAEAWSDRVDIVASAPVEIDADGEDTTDAILVRPDGYVAWTDPDGGDLVSALRRWFGSAAAESAPRQT